MQIDKKSSSGSGSEQIEESRDFKTNAISQNDMGQEVETPETRKARLSGWFTIAASGFALISDGLQNNIMSLTNVIFAQLYGSAYSSTWSTRISNALLVGAIIGQLSTGFICDILGRKFAIVTATGFIVVGIILVTAAHGANGSFEGFLWFMVIARGITGIGVGAEYPASSTSASEAANQKALKHRGPIFIMVTNFVLAFGTAFACILYLIVFEAAGGVNGRGGQGANYSTVWRTVFGISVIPPVAVFYFRLKMLNSTLYQRGAIKKNIPYRLTLRYYWKSLIGTAGSWFAYDFVTFPNGIFSGVVISSVVKSTGREKFLQTAEWSLLLGAIVLPGVVIGALLVNPIGRRNTMAIGFAGYLVIGLIVGCAYDKVTKVTPAFVVLYGLMQSSGNLGPGDVLGLASSESYATAVRGTLYGFSAAVGKAGAAVGTQAFQPIRDNLGARWTFLIQAMIGVVGVLITMLCVRNDLGRDLAEEDRQFEEFLRSRGWTGQIGSPEAQQPDINTTHTLNVEKA